MDLEDINKDDGLFKEPFDIIMMKEFDDLPSAKDQQKIGKKCKYGPSLRKVDEVTINNKQLTELQTMKLHCGKTSQNEEVVRDVHAISFASLVFKNVKFVYLTRSLAEKLLKQPELFEDKVKGTFARVELPENDVNEKKSHQLVQVTGITKTSINEDNMEIKLRALNIANDISISMLSNTFLSEKECEDLRHQVKDGLLKMPAIEELQQKATSLHEDIIDDLVFRALGKLQAKMDQANEKGQRQGYFELSEKRELLESTSERKWLIHDPLNAIADVQTFSEEILDDRLGNQGSSESVPIKDPRSALKDMVMDDKSQYQGSHTSVPVNILLKGNIIASGSSAPAEEHVREQIKEIRPPVPLTIETEQDAGHHLPEITEDMVIQEEIGKGKRVAIEPSANLSSEHPLICMPPPRQGAVTPVYLSPTIMQQSNHELCFSGGLDISGPVQFDDISSIKLVKDVGLLDDQVLVDKYTNAELLNFCYQYDAKMHVVKREIMRRFEKMLNDQKMLDAERRKLEMSLVEANKKLSVVEDELKSLKAKMEEDARLSSIKASKMEEDACLSANEISMIKEDACLKAAKIRKMEEDAQLSDTKMRKMEKDAQLSATKIIKMEEDARLSAAKIIKMEEDALLSAAKIIKMEEDALLSAAKIIKMEEDALLSAAKIIKMEEDALLSAAKIIKMEEDARLSDHKIRKMEEDACLSGTKISKMEKYARVSATTIRNLKKKIVGMIESQSKLIGDTKVQSAEEALRSYKRSKLFVDDVFKLLSPIYSAGWTDALIEIKANHLPELDLGEFPRFDINAWEKADSIYYNISHSPVQTEMLSQRSDCWSRPADPSAATTSGF